MVKSVLNPEIEYEEILTVDKSDIGYDATQFELELFPDIAAVIALGNVKYTFSDKNILYVPVYLIKNGEVQDQIGVYEFLANNYTQLLDEDNDIDIDRLLNPLPLYYKFFTEKVLKSKLGTNIIKLQTGTPAAPTGELDFLEGEVAELEEAKVDADKWSSPNSPTVLTEILGPEQSSKETAAIALMNQEMSEREKYKPQVGDEWIKKFMKNGSYSLLDNEAGGDCLFAIIRDAFRDIPRETTVAELRDIVSKAADEQVLVNYKEHYDMYAQELVKLTARQTEIRDRILVLKVQFSTAAAREEKIKLAAEAKGLNEEFKRLKREKKHAHELIHEFKWMRGIKTLKQLKAKIKTCEFWAESWAINVLERALNIKLIILSSESYREGDVDNVLQCGDMVDADIRKAGKFQPKYYIIASYRGDHYILVVYNGKRIFTFDTLPPSIKQMIVTKCVESRGKGIYNMIPDFESLGKGKSKVETVESKELPVTDSGVEDIGFTLTEKSDEGYKNMKQVSFDPEIIFQFYSKSSGKPKPGKGAGEKIIKAKVLDFADLAAIPQWRQILSNFYKTKKPMEIDGLKWATVENFYQGSKFKRENPKFYATFALDSGSAISTSPEMAKAAGGKTGKYKGKQIRPKDIKIDPHFFSSGENERVMYRGQMAKYKNDALAKQVLLATKNAKLQHFVRGNPPVIFYDTMKIRSLLRKSP